MSTPAPFAPMSRDDVAALLQIAATYDNRNIDDAVINAWLGTARDGRWTYELAVAAIRHHYTEQTAWIMPGHITQFIRNERRKPAPASEVIGELEGPKSTSAGREAAMRVFLSMVGKKIPA